jgi:predicted type IV restriction endonuclease
MARTNDAKTAPKCAAPAEIHALVEKFAEHRDYYHRGSYNETQLRQDFLDPLFIALGWDIYNTAGIHENYRDVILEH